MSVKDIMTTNVTCCTPDTPLREVARMMSERDCGEIPVVDNLDTKRPIGVVTDRDITCRTVAVGKNPLELTANDCMSTPIVTAMPNMSLDECCLIMEGNQIRRVPVVDASGACCGMVSQADIARHASERRVGHLVEEVSKRSTDRSRIHA